MYLGRQVLKFVCLFIHSLLARQRSSRQEVGLYKRQRDGYSVKWWTAMGMSTLRHAAIGTDHVITRHGLQEESASDDRVFEHMSSDITLLCTR